jgi:hypothetical protein
MPHLLHSLAKLVALRLIAAASTKSYGTLYLAVPYVKSSAAPYGIDVRTVRISTRDNLRFVRATKMKEEAPHRCCELVPLPASDCRREPVPSRCRRSPLRLLRLKGSSAPSHPARRRSRAGAPRAGAASDRRREPVPPPTSYRVDGEAPQ